MFEIVPLQIYEIFMDNYKLVILIILTALV